MHVALNLVEFHPGKMGGIETYVRNILQLLPLDDSCMVTVLCSESQVNYFSALISRQRISVVTNGNTTLRRLARSVVRKAVGVDLLAWGINRMPVDIVHTPLTNIRPLKLSKPAVLTFYDMQHEYLPELFTPRELLRRKQKYRKAAEGATMIIAISEHARQGLVERYGIASEKIAVVYLGHGQEFRPIADSDPRCEEIRGLYGLHRPFLYYPAAMWPHKNHQRLLAALAFVRQKHGFAGQLVLTGVPVKGQDAVLREIGRLGLDDVVSVLGHVPCEDLPYLYNLAEMMVFPSLFEGFGIPLVEAMACGCPIVCSDRASIPEVVGNAALVMNPLSPDDMAEKIWHLWSNRSDRELFRQRGLLRARRFSWHETVRKTKEVYGRVVESYRGVP